MLDAGDVTPGGDVAGDEVDDMIAVMVVCGWKTGERGNAMPPTEGQAPQVAKPLAEVRRRRGRL